MVKSKDVLKEYNPELAKLARWLRNVEARKGFFPIVKLLNYGLIKKFVKSKGKQGFTGRIGREEYYILTPKGKKHLTALSQLGF